MMKGELFKLSFFINYLQVKRTREEGGIGLEGKGVIGTGSGTSHHKAEDSEGEI